MVFVLVFHLLCATENKIQFVGQAMSADIAYHTFALQSQLTNECFIFWSWGEEGFVNTILYDINFVGIHSFLNEAAFEGVCHHDNTSCGMVATLLLPFKVADEEVVLLYNTNRLNAFWPQVTYFHHPGSSFPEGKRSTS